MSNPLVILSSGQRCGGTLVQRLLSSHPDVLIWGEHEGQLAALLDIQRTLLECEREVAPRIAGAYERLGHHSFMANLMPDRDSIDDAVRAFVAALFAAPALARGRARWGFKETSYGLAHVEALRELFPDLRVVHVTRDPRDVLVSLDAWERSVPWTRAATLRALSDWVAVNESFADPPPWVASHRYERIVAEPEQFARELAAFADLDHERFDRDVFSVRVHGSGENGGEPRDLRPFRDLPPELRRLLDDPRLRRVAAAYGYDLGSPAASSIAPA